MIAFLAGCGGDYKLTVPDLVTPTSKGVVVVARLQRNDFWIIDLSMKESALRFRLEEGQERSAHTDKLGYAAVRLGTGPVAGTYHVTVSLQDTQGDEAQTIAPVYVWTPDSALVAVDLDSLPVRRVGAKPWEFPKWLQWKKKDPAKDARLKDAWDADVVSASQAISHIAAGANVIYLTRKSSVSYDDCRKILKANGYPDGPVLRWHRERWHTTKGSVKYIPMIVVESRLISQLPEIRKSFAKLKNGICMSDLAAKAFADAGMTPIVVGSNAIGMKNAVRRSSWAELLAKGL